MVDESVDHRGGHDVVAEGLAPAAEWQVRCDDDRALLVAGRDELEEQVRGVGVEGDVADLVDDDELVAADLLSSASSVPAWWAPASRVIQLLAVSNSTEWPFCAALTPSPIARCVLPIPGGPSRITFSAFAT